MPSRVEKKCFSRGWFTWPCGLRNMWFINSKRPMNLWSKKELKNLLLQCTDSDWSPVSTCTNRRMFSKSYRHKRRSLGKPPLPDITQSFNFSLPFHLWACKHLRGFVNLTRVKLIRSLPDVWLREVDKKYSWDPLTPKSENFSRGGGHGSKSWNLRCLVIPTAIYAWGRGVCLQS